VDSGWYFSMDHGQICQVIEAQTLWGETTCRVWLPKVRNCRLNLLAQEQFDQKAHAYPEMVPLLMIRAEGSA